MPRTERLLRLIDILRRHHYPVSGKSLAAELQISLRTLYRDIATLQSQGAEIEGEAGVGYVLKSGFTMPALVFSVEEIEALVLGSRFVISRTDTPLSQAARSALAKIKQVLPKSMVDLCDQTTLIMAPRPAEPAATWLPEIRTAIRNELKLILEYRDLKESITTRTIWPFGVAFFDDVQVVLAYCEKRQEYRHFRIDHIISIKLTDIKYQQNRRYLIKKWMHDLGAYANDKISQCNN